MNLQMKLGINKDVFGDFRSIDSCETAALTVLFVLEQHDDDDDDGVSKT